MLRTSLFIPFCLVAISVAAPAQMLINEFMTGTPDFQELVNCSVSPVDLGGWTSSSWYATAAGALTAETPIVFPAGTVVAPGGYLVLEENGTLGQPGTLPSSYSIGFNYYWTSTRTHEFALTDPSGQGIDYVYLNWFANPTAPNLPVGTFWTGSFDTTSGSGDENRRLTDIDTDAASDWTKTAGSGTPAAVNPGQFGPTCAFNNILNIAQTGPGVGDLNIALTMISPTATAGWTLISTDTTGPQNTGSLFGVEPDALTWALLFSAVLADGNLFSFPVPSPTGAWPNIPFFLPPGAVSSLAGLTLDIGVVLVGPSLVYDGKSNVERVYFQ